MEAVLESATGPAPDPGGDGADEGLLLEEFGDVRRDEFPWELDRSLAALCREEGPLRAVLARIAAHLVSLRAWERIGYARLSDYAVERLGLSARWVRSLAEVGGRLDALPRLEHALVSGTLGWTKVRLLARLPREEDEAVWIAHARRVTAEQLSREVRAVDRGSMEAGAAEDEGARSRRFEVRCSSEVCWKWYVARGAAARAAGRPLHVCEAAELIAAEVLSAQPIDEQADEGPCEEAGVSWSQESQTGGETPGSELSETGSVRAIRPPWRANGAEPARPIPSLPRPSLPPGLKPLLDGLEEADAFGLDDRLRRALSMEQRLDGRIGPLLALVWQRWVHRALGYTTRDAYARERLGMDATRARALVRLERAAVQSEAFARDYRTGALSWVKADVLAPLVSADPLGWFVEDWVVWAGRVTVRRLREDVERALALAETDPEAFRRGGGLPPQVRHEREIGAGPKGTGEYEAGWDREIGATRRGWKGDLEEADREIGAARSAPEESCSVWGAFAGKLAARHKVFARDGWRCAVPGCTSMQNLHDHHIRFRSAGGPHALENRITLCAFHHLRGVHAGLLWCVGRAPDGLRWEMGIRPGVTNLLAYRSGDLRVPPRRTPSGLSTANSSPRFSPSVRPAPG